MKNRREKFYIDVLPVWRNVVIQIYTTTIPINLCMMVYDPEKFILKNSMINQINDGSYFSNFLRT